MSNHRIEIQEAPEVTPFVLMSLWLHIALGVLITLMIVFDLIPEKKVVETKIPAVKVKYLPPEKKETPKTKKLADIPKPRTIEAPKSSELIARYDSRAHSNRGPKKRLRYQNKKTVIPKTKKSVKVPKKSRPHS